MSAIHSVYSVETGIFTGRTMSGAADFLAQNTPQGCALIEGSYAPMRERVDIESGQVVPYQPPAPPADEWQTWAWDADAWAWVSVPTEAALARDARAERDRRLFACDWTQLPDAPESIAAAWRPYRQALRDITQQAGFPASITWPQEPTA